MLSGRRILFLALLAGILSGCTHVVQLRDPKSGQTVTCGGAMWTPTSGTKDKHCLDYWHSLGYAPVP